MADPSLDAEMAEVERLKTQMLKQVYYVMHRRIVAPERLKPVMLAHYRWIISLEQQNRVFASGPLFARDGSPGVGMTIFRAADFEEAERLAAGDPFVRSGAAEFEIARWQVNEGRISISIDFSNQTLQFE